MSDTDGTVEPEEDQLHYLGATTRHDGPGDSKKPLPKIDASELTGDLQPGVTGDAEPKHRKER
jgi:hypothetical protein